MNICFLDIETTGFNRRTDKVFVVCCASSRSNRVKSFSGSEKEVIILTSRHLATCDYVATWNGSTFDIPFLAARAKGYGISFKVDNHIDMQRHAAKMMPGIKASLDNFAKMFNVNAQKSPFSDEIWSLARAGDKMSLKYIIDHCKKDVLVLKQLWPFIME